METKFIVNHISRIRDKANAFLVRQLEEHHMKGISPSHGDILWALLFSGELSMKDLAENINRDKSTVTALVNKLIKFGYVKKRTDINDNRVNLISLTPKGLKLKDDVIAISEALREKAYQGLTEKDKAVLMKLLDKIYQNF
ncbi:MAG: MarR family transcriptional regulator [Desulfobacteraceae bacterium]|nr:MarR family transcriptional regulator [Desulfobacteraceae bacterium]MBC2755504.1 MarR family transcriptional regulator [Desulfobacteraceae bacterium]